MKGSETRKYERVYTVKSYLKTSWICSMAGLESFVFQRDKVCPGERSPSITEYFIRTVLCRLRLCWEILLQN